MISTATREEIEALARRYPSRQSALMPAMDLLQRESGGCIDAEDLRDLAELIGVSVAEAHGVRTYYTMYNQSPVGRYHLQVDTNVPAMLMGATEILESLKALLGVDVGETTPDGLFTLSAVEDLASCGTCPVIQVNDRYFENMTVEKTGLLIESLRAGRMPDWQPEMHVYSECGILLKHRCLPGSTALATYRGDGGYEGLEKALSMEPAAVVAEVKAAELRGRGGAGFPTAVKWGFVPDRPGGPVYLVCNADEGEPGTFKDRQIMEFDPHLLIEGMAIAAHAIGATQGFIYIRGEFTWIAHILESACAEAREAGLLGRKILGSGLKFDIVVHRGAGAYVCGEETALLESLEGRRGHPRLKPPFPALKGLYARPTIVNNVETLACVPYILREGHEAFRSIGVAGNYGPKIFGVSGHVNTPGVFEFPLGTPLGTVLEAAGGVKGKLKGVIVGGLSAPILTAEEASDLTLDFDSCQAHGTALGSGGIIAINDGAGMPEIALRVLRFYEHESCGQCTPCREGSRVMVALLENVLAGRGSSADVDRVVGLCRSINGATLCPGGDAFTKALEAMITKFRPEFDVVVADEAG